MIKRLCALLFLIAVFASAQSYAGGPYTGGILTNPAINTILADSGARPPGGKSPGFVVCSTVSAAFTMEYRDAANAVNLYSQVFTVVANQCFQYTYPVNFDTADQERIRLRLNAAITGSMQASLFD
jgi:hypothetical protein